MRRLLMLANIFGLAVIAMMVVISIHAFRTAMERSRQKHTLNVIYLAADRFEKGQAIGPLLDAWDRPMRVHVAGKHYTIQSAASDGQFQAGPFQGRAPGYEDDIVLIDGVFWQIPDGI